MTSFYYVTSFRQLDSKSQTLTHLFSKYRTKCRLYQNFIYLFNIALWMRENVNNASVYTDHAICAHTYSVTEQQCICDGDHDTVAIIAFWRHNILHFMKMHVPKTPDYMMLTKLDLRLEVWPFCRNNCIFNTCCLHYHCILLLKVLKYLWMIGVNIKVLSDGTNKLNTTLSVPLLKLEYFAYLSRESTV